jgi:hypothetical protein
VGLAPHDTGYHNKQPKILHLPDKDAQANGIVAWCDSSHILYDADGYSDAACMDEVNVQEHTRKDFKGS